MNFRLLKDEETEQIMPDLFKEIFKLDSWFLLFPMVVIAEECGEIIGFGSGNAANRLRFYFQYCAILPKYKGKGMAKELLNGAMRYLNYRFYSTLTPNDNTAAIRSVLSCGFKIVGTRQDEGGNLLVEWLKDMENK
jgi:RimJ/RimL family protein N-acetyltransferase